MVPKAHPTHLPKRHLDRFSRLARLANVTNTRTDRQTDIPTDHATPYVAIGHYR